MAFTGVTEKKLLEYHKIYEQIYEDPFIPLYKVARNINIARSIVFRYAKEMYESSILQGPFISLKPAENRHQYAHFLVVDDPFSVYRWFEGFPGVISRSLTAGAWNVLVICDQLMDVSALEGVNNCIVKEVKGVTHLSKVSGVDWDESIQEMKSAPAPEEKFILYEEGPELLWKEPEWTLFDQFKYNIRKKTLPVLKKVGIRYEQYQEWVSQLPEVALVQPAFFPLQQKNYFFFDFLFQSEYHKGLTNVLGMLPSTCYFFSVREYLLARLSFVDKKQRDDLYLVIKELVKKGYITRWFQAMVIFSGE
ncbi:MAG: hypothetical protein HXS46_13020 [Theionarchaea archaeon]|nr:MAG: hypothetical protein AYK18_11750 [Theionarchaea archaeon DG-70]MBU7011605.1 hypothetical protein [Theionarchaea archaeon]